MGGGKGETAPFCPINVANAQQMERTHDPREIAWERRIATRLQGTFDGDQETAEASNKEPEDSAHGKEDDQQPT